jgi:hypothetical protein
MVSQMDKIYNFDKNGLFVGESPMEFDPIDKAPMIPANATTIKPLQAKEGFTINFVNGNWAYVGIDKVKPEQPLEPYYIWDEVSWSWVVDFNLQEVFLAEQAKAEARAYLNSTDWYIIRQTETGVAIPDDVLAKRAVCRELL